MSGGNGRFLLCSGFDYFLIKHCNNPYRGVTVSKMSPAAGFHAQLASIMEVLANTAVAEICELVDSGYSVLQLEISRSRKENELLRRKLRLLELRAARGSALRSAAAGSGAAHHRSNAARAGGAPSCRVSIHETPGGRDVESSSDSSQKSPQPATKMKVKPAAVETVELMDAVIKVEDDDDEDESWNKTEQDNFSCNNRQNVEPEAPPTLTLHDVEEGGVSGLWVSTEVSSSSTSVQRETAETSTGPDPLDYDCLMYEPSHDAHITQNAVPEDPSCSYAVNTSASVSADTSSFPFVVSGVSLPAVEQSGQKRAALPSGKPPDGFSSAANHSSDDGGGKVFVCSRCGKTLACLKNLKTHMRVHTGEKPFGCVLCGKRFSDSSNLKRHQSVHTGEKRYGCVHCGKRFAQSGSLKVHMNVHTDCKQFRCNYCGKTFISGNHLRRHVTVHDADKHLPAPLQ
ncbi:zinc finger protein 578-like isoform X2 [Thalassophryne amazonica]|uniref:zinc finger protein 578-like isoform X2 n=1 Tax=Thalassophryne amazonica TaxID=390379 RepID=UPI001471C560|nr:zinc finger protein 578-like isoform X2 [Thalassophryne amazonica]